MCFTPQIRELTAGASGLVDGRVGFQLNRQNNNNRLVFALNFLVSGEHRDQVKFPSALKLEIE